MIDYLVISAVEAEQQEFISLLKTISTEVPANLKMFCCGIGSVQAAANVSFLLGTLYGMKNTLQKVYFLGSAGSYSKTIPLNTVVRSFKALYSDAAAMQNQAYIPQSTNNMQELVSLSAELQSNFTRGKTCLCLPSITTDAKLVDLFGKQAELENLELFGVATAAKLFKITWEGVLGISNYVGPNAHQEWKENNKQVMQVASKELFNDLKDKIKCKT